MTDHGKNPDYRFTLANERTLLAWLRTALALVAAGVAVVHLVPDLGIPGARRVIGAILAGLGATVAITSMLRWRVVQAAMRRGEDLPPSRAPLLVGGALAVLSLLVLVLLVVHGGTT
ncbi:MAG: YidH family protein [Pseudonocardiaceae bacterium]